MRLLSISRLASSTGTDVHQWWVVGPDHMLQFQIIRSKFWLTAPELLQSEYCRWPRQATVPLTEALDNKSITCDSITHLEVLGTAEAGFQSWSGPAHAGCPV